MATKIDFSSMRLEFLDENDNELIIVQEWRHGLQIRQRFNVDDVIYNSVLLPYDKLREIAEFMIISGNRFDRGDIPDNSDEIPPIAKVKEKQ